jgi:hypothetical protein
MELIDITPEDSIVPVYLEVLDDEEQAIRNAEIAQAQADEEARKAKQQAKEEMRQSALAKLTALGLTADEVAAL